MPSHRSDKVCPRRQPRHLATWPERGTCSRIRILEASEARLPIRASRIFECDRAVLVEHVAPRRGGRYDAVA